MQRKGQCKGVARTIGVAVVAVIVIGIFYYFSLSSGIGRPNERDRVKHPSGFSAIGPAGWAVYINRANPPTILNDQLRFEPNKAEGRPIVFVVARLGAFDEAKQTEGYQRIELGGRSMFHKLTEKRDRIESYFFQEQGHWYEIGVTRHRGDYDDAGWAAFVESFRIEKPMTTLPATTLPGQ